MTTESILYKLYSELQLEAYNEETHSYDYKRTNQIIRANIEAIPELLKLNKSDVISSVCEHDLKYRWMSDGSKLCEECGEEF